MQDETNNTRRGFLKAALGTGLAAVGGIAGAQSFEFKPNQRYPDPAVLILDPSFTKYRIYSSTIEQVATEQELQPLDLRAYRRLRHPELGRGLGEAAQVDDGDKRPQQVGWNIGHFPP